MPETRIDSESSASALSSKRKPMLKVIVSGAPAEKCSAGTREAGVLGSHAEV